MIHHYRAGEESLQPDVLVFILLIKCSTRCSKYLSTAAEKRKVLQLALQAMETLEKGEFCPPNDDAYAMTMLAINQLAGTAHQREELLASVFQRCAVRGHVSNSVLKEMNHGGSLRLFLHLTDGKNRLEADWSRNVHPSHRPHTVQ